MAAAFRRGRAAVIPRGRAAVLLVPLTATVGAAVLLRGGYFAAGRAVFAILAGLTLLACLARDERAAAQLMRSPAVLLLGGLGALAGLSALWTVGDPADAVSAAMLVLGLAAVAVVAGVAARSGSSDRIALVIVVVAALAAACGLLGVALREEPWAQRIGGSWRPGGPFEYPPALALLQVSALPALLRWMVRAVPGPAALAALGGALAACTLALASSRLHLALAGLIALAAVAWPSATVGARRLPAAAAVALMTTAALAASALAGGYARAAAVGGDGERLLSLLAIVAGATLLWAALRPLVGKPAWPPAGRRRSAAPTRAPAARSSAAPAGAPPARSSAAPVRSPARGRLSAPVALAALAVAVVAAALLAAAPAVFGSGGFTHGRLALWEDALATVAERPVAGAGAGGFLVASAERQGEAPTRHAHNLALDMAVELGLPGVLLVLLLYAAVAAVLLRARGLPALWLLGPAVAAFPIANLVDWPWQLAGCGAVWALALGGLIAATPPRPSEAAPWA